MYHSISDDPELGVAPYYRVCTSPRRFAEQIQWLADWGYHGVTLTEGLAWLRSEEAEKPTTDFTDGTDKQSHSQPAKLVALTFDDGFRDFYTEAFPVLRRHGFSATMYLPTAFIGADDADRRIFAPARSSLAASRSTNTPFSLVRRSCLTWSEVRELATAGIEFGSHTVHHPKLIELSPAEVEAELRDSKATVEHQLGTLCPAFAYPYAFPQHDARFTSRFCALLPDTGYTSGVTTQIGLVNRQSQMYRLPRLPMNSADDRPLLQAKLAGAYDWLAGPQHAFKTLKRIITTNAPQHG
jgi:peptidoglycan/xylan/chitin deacetylase (PgdA/CDA1 family)